MSPPLLNLPPEQGIAVATALALGVLAAKRYMDKALRPRRQPKSPPRPRPGRGALAGALPTVYQGYHFRSRLEARWATFLDVLGAVVWSYEHQGFRLPDGTLYLPDFFLLAGWWLEIKGQVPTAEEAKRCVGLAAVTGQPVVLAVGLPSNQYLTVYLPGSRAPRSGTLAVCVRCDRPFLTFDGGLLPFQFICTCANRRFGTSRRLQLALDAAKAARFEQAA